MRVYILLAQGILQTVLVIAVIINAAAILAKIGELVYHTILHTSTY